MKGLKRNQCRMAMILIFFMVTLGLSFGGYAYATGVDVLDQKQENYSGNIWTNHDNPRYQTFTPAITGNLSRIDLNVDGLFGSPGAIQVSIYKEGDMLMPLATAQSTSYSSGWVSIDFSGTQPYLKKETMYRMVVSTELGGGSGIGWYASGGNPYSRGSFIIDGYDMSFRTYMIADYSISPAESVVSIADSSLIADGTSQTTVTVKLKDAQGNDMNTGGASVAISSTLGTISSVTDNNNGTYTATLTASKTAGTATISASVGGSTIEKTASVQFVPGPEHR